MKKKGISLGMYAVNLIALFTPWISVGGEFYTFFQFLYKLITQGTNGIITEAGVVAENLTTMKVGIILESVLICVYFAGSALYICYLFGKIKFKNNLANIFIAVAIQVLHSGTFAMGALGEVSVIAMAVLPLVIMVTMVEYPVREICDRWDKVVEENRQYEMEEAAFEKEKKERLAFAGKYTKLFYYVIIKNFIKNWKDYALLLVCNVVIFGFVVTGFGMQEILSGLSDYQGLGMFSGVTTILLNALIPMAIISVIVIIILFFYYLKCRARNNGVLLTLGMRRGSLYYFVALEFVSVVVIALIIGSILGTGILYIFAQYTGNMLGETIGLSLIGPKTYFKAILTVLVLYAVSIMASSNILVDFNVGRTTDLRAMRERIFRSGHVIFIAVGAGITGFCIYSYGQIYRYESMILLAASFIGLLFVIMFGIAKVLLDERKKPEYLKKMLLHNQLFHKSRTNSAFIYAIILIQACVLFYFSFQGISSSTAGSVDELYPYDLVCIADDGDDEFFENLQNEYEMTMLTYPMVRVVSNDSTERREQGFTTIQGQHIGVSESTYHEMKKQLDPDYEAKDLGLDSEGKLVHIVYQQDESAKAKRLDYTLSSKKPLLREGVVCTYFTSISVNRGDVAYEYKQIAGEEIESLIGVFQQGLRENIVVYSDEYFAVARESWKEINAMTGEKFQDESEKIPDVTLRQGPTKLVLINADEENLEGILKHMSEFDERHELDKDYDRSVATYYVKEDSARILQAERIMKMAMNILLIVLFFVMNIMLIIIKILSEKEMCTRRADFLKCMGMRTKDRKGYVKKEILYYFHILPLVISMIVSMLFTVAVFHARQYTLENIKRYVLYMFPIWGVYILGSSVLLWIVVTIYAKRLEGKKYGSNS